MAQVDDYLRKQAAELLQALNEGCYKEDNIPCQIEESLFLGSFGAANNEEELNRLNITHILTVGSAMPPAYPNDFVYIVLKVSDGPSTNIKQHFDECFDYIEEAKRSGGSVLVHCFVGRSRSVVVVVPYLLKKHGMTLFKALDHVKSGRARAAPNAGFSTQLYEYEMFLSGTSIYFTMKPAEFLQLRKDVKLVLVQVVCRESSDELKPSLEAAKSICRSWRTIGGL